MFAQTMAQPAPALIDLMSLFGWLLIVLMVVGVATWLAHRFATYEPSDSEHMKKYDKWSDFHANLARVREKRAEQLRVSDMQEHLLANMYDLPTVRTRTPLKHEHTESGIVRVMSNARAHGPDAT